MVPVQVPGWRAPLLRGWETCLPHLTLCPRGMGWVLSDRSAHEGISGQTASGRTALAEDKGPLGKRLMSFSPCLSLSDRKTEVKRGKSQD